MTALVAPGVSGMTTATSRARAETLLVRLLGIVAFLGLPVGLSLFGANAGTRELARSLAGYSPERLAHGEVWTLPCSAFLLPRVGMIGPTTIFTIAFFLPYALLRGSVRAVVVFLSGHVSATLSVATYAIVGHLAGVSFATSVYHRVDVGASAGLAAGVGAFGWVMFRRSRTIGVAILAGSAGFFLFGLARGAVVMRSVTEVEHLLALAAGVVTARMLDARWRAGRLARS